MKVNIAILAAVIFVWVGENASGEEPSVIERLEKIKMSLQEITNRLDGVEAGLTQINTKLSEPAVKIFNGGVARREGDAWKAGCPEDAHAVGGLCVIDNDNPDIYRLQNAGIESANTYSCRWNPVPPHGTVAVYCMEVR